MFKVLADPLELPVSHTEKLVAALWSEILAVDELGRGENFFDLGGESIKAVTALGWLQDNLGVEVPYSKMHRAATVHQFAAYLDAEFPEEVTKYLRSL